MAVFILIYHESNFIIAYKSFHGGETPKTIQSF